MNRIKELRKAKGMLQKELADELQVAQNTLSYWEQGKFQPDNAMLEKIADFFGVSVDYLLGRDDNKGNALLMQCITNQRIYPKKINKLF